MVHAQIILYIISFPEVISYMDNNAYVTVCLESCSRGKAEADSLHDIETVSTKPAMTRWNFCAWSPSAPLCSPRSLGIAATDVQRGCARARAEQLMRQGWYPPHSGKPELSPCAQCLHPACFSTLSSGSCQQDLYTAARCVHLEMSLY